MPGILASQKSDDAQNASPIIGIQIQENQKFCPKCKEVKNRTEFHKSKQLSDGLYSYCKVCSGKKRADWYDKNGDIVKKKAKLYRIENNEEVRKKYRESYAANQAARVRDAKNYRDKNKEEINKRRREKRINDPEWRAADSLRQKERYEADKEAFKIKRNQYYSKTKKRRRELVNKKYQSLTREQKDLLNAKSREWYQKNKIAQAEKLRNRRNNDIVKKLSNNISTSIRHSIKGEKEGRHWESLVGYTVQDIMTHLESQFTEGMTWEHFMRGEIHIDHKIPLVLFDFQSPEDRKFKAAWSLKNLQPLWAKDNLAKQDKILYPELLIELLFD